MSSHRTPEIALVGCLTLCLLLSGCEDSYPEVHPVRGTVTLEGRSLSSGVVTFLAEDGTECTGTIGQDGVYRLGTFVPEDGAIEGEYKVIITPVPGMYSLITIPERYGDPETSGIVRTVNKGENKLDFDLRVAP